MYRFCYYGDFLGCHAFHWILFSRQPCEPCPRAPITIQRLGGPGRRAWVFGPMSTRTKLGMLNLAASYPLMWLALVYLYILRARFHFGHWPSPSDGMAKYQSFASLHHTIAVCSLRVSPLVLLGVLGLACICRWRDSQFRVWIPISVLVCSILLWVVFSATDPGGFILWFAD